MNSTRTSTLGAVVLSENRPGIIDCDVHPDVRNGDEIRERLPAPFKDHWKRGGRGLFRTHA